MERILDKYGFTNPQLEKVQGKTVNDVYIVCENEKRYILKKCLIKREEAIRSVLSQVELSKSGAAVPKILSTIDHKFYVEDNNSIFFLQEYVHGRIYEPKKDGSADNIYTFMERIERDLDILKIDFNSNNIPKEYNKAVLINNCDQYYKSDIQELKQYGDLKKQIILSTKLNDSKKQMKIIHNDIRPRNIIVTENGKWNLIDFDFVRFGSLCFELGSATMFLTDYSVETSHEILIKICEKAYPDLCPRDIINDLLLYYLYNNFPLDRPGLNNPGLLLKTIKERVEALRFCKEYLDNYYE